MSDDLIPNFDREPFKFEKESLARQMSWIEIWNKLWKLLVLGEKQNDLATLDSSTHQKDGLAGS